MIRFVSNLPADLRSGGFSAMNAAAFAAVSDRWLVRYAGPIDPPALSWQKGLSKALRVAGLRGDFSAYSRRRLRTIAAQAAARDWPDSRIDFFHGFTPWVALRPSRPYLAWSDCTFHDYIDIFHDRAQFRPGDLTRVETMEAAWLAGASRVLFTSRWASERAIAGYRLDPARVRSIGIFGEIEPPDLDRYDGGQRFAFVSTNFAAKGGPVVLEAFRRLRASHPAAELTIVGAPPPDLSEQHGVQYAGYLRKESAEENARLRQILASSVAVVHPTQGDIAPLLLVEAACFGCPAIASRAFAIPEIVDDGVGGLLLDRPTDADEVAAAMRWMLENPAAYASMRAAGLRGARERLSKAAFTARLQGEVAEVLDEAGVRAA